MPKSSDTRALLPREKHDAQSTAHRENTNKNAQAAQFTAIIVAATF